MPGSGEEVWAWYVGALVSVAAAYQNDAHSFATEFTNESLIDVTGGVIVGSRTQCSGPSAPGGF
ncbi:hypothetical protein [Aliamphritea spongicola]|nr:hypothetical protein [Aliamphritea spongicola]